MKKYKPSENPTEHNSSTSEEEFYNKILTITNPDHDPLIKFKERVTSNTGYQFATISKDTHRVYFKNRAELVKYTRNLTPHYFGENSEISVPQSATQPPPWLEEVDTDEEERSNSSYKKKNKKQDTENPNPFTMAISNSAEQEHSVQITNHAIGIGNPIRLKQILNKYDPSLAVPMPPNFSNRNLAHTTIIFSTKAKLIAFTKTVPTKEFGPDALYTTGFQKPKPTTPTLPHTDWNGVMRGVDPDITDEDLTAELHSSGIKIREISRITSKEGHRTFMVRIFFQTRQDAEEAINDGITLVGRRYRIEPPLHGFRHEPCRNCCQYGHTATNCKSPPKCHRCGKHPTACTHQKHTNDLVQCSTCDQPGHYTGQTKCPKYPKEEGPPPDLQQQ